VLDQMQGSTKPLGRTVTMASLSGSSGELPERRGNCYAGRGEWERRHGQRPTRLTQHSFGWVLRCGMKMS
jgi:hypothetical protein